nr:hypothetical protein [Tanacetum cinerariifolium]
MLVLMGNKITPLHDSVVRIPTVDNMGLISYVNSSGGSHEVVKDDMDSGKREAFPVVENYAKNAWIKFGLVRVTMNSNGIFFFKFTSIEAFTADRLSVMVTKLGNLIMLDSYTSSMWVQSWGRMDDTHALIDIRPDRELKEDMVIAIPNVEDDGEVLYTVMVEYEREPPRCGVGTDTPYLLNGHGILNVRSVGNVEDKILVPKLPKNCARCARCGHPVDGPYCQGCALLRKKLEEDLVTYFQDFQNTSESSDDSTNVVNAPRDPFMNVVTSVVMR